MQWIKKTLVILLLISLMPTVNASSNATEQVLAVNQRIIQSLQANKARYQANPDQLYTLVKQDLLPFIDFQAFSKLILGIHWKTARPAQQQRFIQVFQNMLMSTYTNSLLAFSESTLTISREVAGSKAGYSKVYGIFANAKGQKGAQVIFEMRQQGNHWKAYNITVNAFSLVQNFRSSFAREINQSGLDGLIKRLESKQITH
jgi:phospholipid transport system substrate-binding protein